MKPQRTVLRDDRKTVTQLLAAAEKDADAVSVFMAGCTVADTEAALFVVKGPEAIAYLRELCKRQGLLTDKPVTGPSKPKTAAQMRYDAAHDTSCVGAFARARP